MGSIWCRKERGRACVLALLLALLVVAGPGLHRAGAQAGDPSLVGQWSALKIWPVVAVHTHLLPTGKVMFWPYSDGPRLWDPASDALTNLASAGYNLFCSAHAYTADGRLFVAGGHIENNIGLDDASYYDPLSNTWTRLPDMNAGRWYPTCTTLANGDLLVVTGDTLPGVNNPLPQVWQPASGTWRNLTGAQLVEPLFIRHFLAPNGSVFAANTTSRYLDTSGVGSWSTVGNMRQGGRNNYGATAMYEPGKILFTGGVDPPVATAETIDLNQASPAWQFTGSMSSPRRQINVTMLPDGKALVTGGSSAAGFNNDTAPVLSAESWDPQTGSWTLLASCTQYRGYHSTAVLLPDGRVLSAGGDNHPNAEVFSPPYLFKGARPTITAAPATIVQGQSFFVGTPEAASISQVSLVRLGSATHANNMDQRFLRLDFVEASGGLTVSSPGSGNICPPGYYMMFILNSTGVPSLARMVRAVPQATSVPGAPSGLTALAASPSQLVLSWVHTGITEDGFKIERSPDGLAFEEIATVGLNVTTYTDGGLEPGSSFVYRVRAFNSAGNSIYSPKATGHTPVPAGGTGLRGDYYNNMDFTGTTVTRTDARIDFNWGTGSPDGSLGADTFSVRWTGQIEPWFSGPHTFYTTTDDGVRVWLNGQLIIDRWFDQSPTEWAAVPVDLTVGVRYDLRVDYYENVGGATAQLAWSTPSQVKGIVPQSQLYPAAPPGPGPAAPSGLTATAVSRSRIDLAWTDNAFNEWGFRIERSRNATSWHQIASVGRDVTAYSSTGLRRATTYYFRVLAYNGAANSAYSNTASATTLP